jgi:hypothetical protein
VTRFANFGTLIVLSQQSPTTEDDSETEAKPKAQCIAVTKKSDRCKCKPRNGAPSSLFTLRLLKPLYGSSRNQKTCASLSTFTMIDDNGWHPGSRECQACVTALGRSFRAHHTRDVAGRRAGAQRRSRAVRHVVRSRGKHQQATWRGDQVFKLDNSVVQPGHSRDQMRQKFQLNFDEISSRKSRSEFETLQCGRAAAACRNGLGSGAGHRWHRPAPL